MNKLGFSLLAIGHMALPLAHAVNVSINPDTYNGNWLIQGVSDFARGAQTMNLNPGSYDLWVGSGSRFSFLVDASGNVTSLNTAAATGGSGMLTFNTADVTVNSGGYTGYLLIAHVSDYFTGSVTATLVPGLRYNLYVGPLGIVPFDVDGSGNVASGNAAAAQGGPGQLTLQTADVNVDPGSYQGLWLISHVSDFVRGAQTVKLVPGLNYDFYVGLASPFRILVGADGNVTSTNTAAATGGMLSLALNTVEVNVNAGSYQGYWKIAHLHEFTRGSQRVHIVPGLAYHMLIGSLDAFRIDVAANGTLTSTNGAAAAGGNGLTFGNVQLKIDPGAFQGYWQIAYVNDPTTGPAELTVVPNITYEVKSSTGEVGLLSLDANGKIAESSVVFGGVGFTFSEPNAPPPPDPDSDNDGVKDSDDLCDDTRVKPKHRQKRVDDDGCTRKQRLKLLRHQIHERLKEFFKQQREERRKAEQERKEQKKQLEKERKAAEKKRQEELKRRIEEEKHKVKQLLRRLLG